MLPREINEKGKNPHNNFELVREDFMKTPIFRPNCNILTRKYEKIEMEEGRIVTGKGKEDRSRMTLQDGRTIEISEVTKNI